MIEELRRLYRAEPYRPIEFELDNGMRFVLPHRGLLLINEDGSRAGAFKLDGDPKSPDPVESGRELYRFRGSQVVRVGYVGESTTDQRRATG